MASVVEDERADDRAEGGRGLPALAAASRRVEGRGRSAALVTCLVVAGCGASSDGGRTVAGRTRSAAPEVVGAEPGATLRWTRDGAAPERVAFEARLTAEGASAAALRLPDGERELALAREVDGAFSRRDEGPGDEVMARFPPGTYAFVAEWAAGGETATSVRAFGTEVGWPRLDPPVVEGPPEARALVLRWRVEGQPAATYDLVVRETEGGAALLEVRDLLEPSFALPTATLALGRPYALELSAASGPSTDRARAVATIRTELRREAP